MTQHGKREPGKLPHGKVQCYISKQVVDEAETVEMVFNGIRVRVHRRYLGCAGDPAPIP
ncbi:MAG: hypothetical protein JXB32_07205 [Deltaproteobacteria bacterium]|nr:hypothetical protein [Deltaproteobacteria bacterium]